MEILFSAFDYQNELPVQRRLFEECFPETIGTPTLTDDHYRWKFHTKPGEWKSAEFKACSDGDMLGYYAAIPYHYSFRGEKVTAAMVCDVMTGVKARGKGIFTKLGMYATDELEKQGFDFTTGYPIRKEVIPGHLKAGWEIYFELPLYGKFVRFNSFLKKKRIGFLAPFVNNMYWCFTGLLSFLFLPSKKGLKAEVNTSDEFQHFEELEVFYRQWGNNVTFSLIKDSDFLKWRLSAPGKKYYLISLRDGQLIVGNLIARDVEREGIPCIGILDLALLSNYEKHAHLLTRELAKTARRSGRELLLVMLQKNWYQGYRLCFDTFMKTPFKFYLIVKRLQTSIEEKVLKDEKNWHLMWIDSDDL